MAKSLPPVSAKVIADIEQFVSDFRRAENVARRTADNIDREVGELAKKVKSKMSLGDIGKDILRGAGLFGGFQIAQTAADLIVDHFREAADLAQKIEQSTARQLEYTRQMIALRETDDQRRIRLEAAVTRAKRDLDEANAPKFRTNLVVGPLGDVVEERIPRAATQKEIAAANELAEAYQKASLALEEFKKAQSGKDEKQRLQELENDVRSYGRTLAANIKTEQENRKAQGASVEKLQDAANKYRDLAQPMRDYYRELDRITDLEMRKVMSADEALAARKAVADAFYKGAPNHSGVSVERVDDTINTVDEDTKELANTARELGLTFSSAFEDAIVGGEKLSEVIRGLAQDVLRLFVRQTITTPVANWLTSAFSAGMKLPGFATGGDFTVGGGGGTDSQLVAFRATPGERVSVRTPGQADGGGQVFNFNYSFGSGVTRQELAGLVPAIVEASKRAVAEAANRGGGFKRAFA